MLLVMIKVMENMGLISQGMIKKDVDAAFKATLKKVKTNKNLEVGKNVLEGTAPFHFLYFSMVCLKLCSCNFLFGLLQKVGKIH